MIIPLALLVMALFTVVSLQHHVAFVWADFPRFWQRLQLQGSRRRKHGFDTGHGLVKVSNNGPRQQFIEE